MMEKRNHFLLSELHLALYREEPTPENVDSGTSATPGSDPTDPTETKVEGDFVMHTAATEELGPSDVNYNERLIATSGSTTPRPIHEEEEPERVVLIMDLPKDFENWTMRVGVSNGNHQDQVKMLTKAGNYDQFYHELSQKFTVIKEEPGVFFTVKIEAGKFRTYLNIDQDDEVALLRHSRPKTFEKFRFSFLTLVKK